MAMLQHAGGVAGRPIAEAIGPAVRRAHPTVVGALEAARGSALSITFHGTRPAITGGGTELVEGAWRAAVALRRAGVGAGEAVILLLPSSPALAHALFGAMLAGAVPAPLATPMTFGSAARYLSNLSTIVRASGARVVVTDRRLAREIGGDPVLRDALRTVITPDELAEHPSTPVRPRSPSDLALLQYTSGTTGDPKGVAISHRALTANTAAIAHGLGIDDTDVGVSWLPMHHDMGLIGVLMTAVCHPYPIHVLRPEAFVMQPRAWLRVLAEHRGTLSVAPSSGYALCLRRAGDFDGDLSSWRVALDGAEPVQAETLERFTARHVENGLRAEALTPVYGMAEATLAVTFTDPTAPPAVLRLDPDSLGRGRRVRRSTGPGSIRVVSVGRPVAGAAVRIADVRGAPAEEGRVGEILVGGDSLLDGYYRDPDATGSALRDGWLHSGDLGFLEGGELFVVGREKDVVIVGGRNIHPHDVERVAADVPAVIGAAAFGVDDAAAGTQQLVVAVESRRRDLDEQERLGRTVRGELLSTLGVKARVEVWPVGAIPRTTSGKIRRAECARLLRGSPS